MARQKWRLAGVTRRSRSRKNSPLQPLQKVLPTPRPQTAGLWSCGGRNFPFKPPKCNLLRQPWETNTVVLLVVMSRLVFTELKFTQQKFTWSWVLWSGWPGFYSSIFPFLYLPEQAANLNFTFWPMKWEYSPRSPVIIRVPDGKQWFSTSARIGAPAGLVKTSSAGSHSQRLWVTGAGARPDNLHCWHAAAPQTTLREPMHRAWARGQETLLWNPRNRGIKFWRLWLWS